MLLGANLEEANLVGASLVGAFSFLAWLKRANCQNATFLGMQLASAFLQGADLTGANLTGAHLDMAHLKGVSLNKARLQRTVLSVCGDLHEAIGLSEVVHGAHSTLDMYTLRSCVVHLPDVFLEGCGYTRYEIAGLRKMYPRKGMRYVSCFLSHAEKDSKFVDHLRRDLIGENVSCWHYRYDAAGGDYFREQIKTAIRSHDKLIIVCSRRSLLREEVIEEIIEAIQEERATGTQKLFPIRLDEFVFSRKIDQAYKELPPRQRREDWLPYLRTYNILDFRNWRDESFYRVQLMALVCNLRDSPDERF